LKTNAHPLVEITWMRQKDRRLAQLINLTGHSDTAYFNPVRMTEIRIGVKGNFNSAHAVRSGTNMAVANEGSYSEFVLPVLDEYEIVELR
jgi:hypothetical protein